MSDWMENLKRYALSDDMDYRLTWEDAALALEEIERLRDSESRWTKAAAQETAKALEYHDELKRLRPVVNAAQRLYSGGLYPENHDYVLISDLSLDALDKALAAYDQSSG